MGNINDTTNLTGPAPQVIGNDAACIVFTSGAAGVAPKSLPSNAGPFKSIVILNGVGTTFALTLPSPQQDGEECQVLFVTEISGAFSCIAKAPAKTIIEILRGFRQADANRE